jgi:hypothetical protein
MAQINYNKTFLIQINKDLAVRRNALPILQSKEAALRAEARRIRSKINEMDKEITSMFESLSGIKRLWSEFPDFVRLEKVTFKEKNWPVSRSRRSMKSCFIPNRSVCSAIRPGLCRVSS